MLRMIASAAALSAVSVMALASCTTPAPEQVAAAVEPAKPAGPHPGEAVYKKSCAACHDNPEATKAPSRETLARMASGNITNALMTGKMIAQATGLSSAEVSFVSDYLSDSAAVSDDWITAMRCPANRATPKLTATPTVATFGFDQKNRRNLSYAQTGLKAADLTNLEVAWVVAFPDAVSMRSQAAVVGNTLFLPVGESKNRVFAFDISDAAKPCIQWVHDGERTFRTSAGYGVRKDGVPMVLVGDMGGWTTAIDARNGKRLWITKTGLFDASTSTATPVLVGDTVFAPSSQYEIMMAALEAGADDVARDGEFWAVTCEATLTSILRTALEKEGVTVDSSDLTMIPTSMVELDDIAAVKSVLKLIDALEENDDVQDVYANFDIPDALLEQLAE